MTFSIESIFSVGDRVRLFMSVIQKQTATRRGRKNVWNEYKNATYFHKHLWFYK